MTASVLQSGYYGLQGQRRQRKQTDPLTNIPSVRWRFLFCQDYESVGEKKTPQQRVLTFTNTHVSCLRPGYNTISQPPFSGSSLSVTTLGVKVGRWSHHNMEGTHISKWLCGTDPILSPHIVDRGLWFQWAICFFLLIYWNVGVFFVTIGSLSWPIKHIHKKLLNFYLLCLEQNKSVIHGLSQIRKYQLKI